MKSSSLLNDEHRPWWLTNLTRALVTAENHPFGKYGLLVADGTQKNLAMFESP